MAISHFTQEVAVRLLPESIEVRSDFTQFFCVLQAHINKRHRFLTRDFGSNGCGLRIFLMICQHDAKTIPFVVGLVDGAG